MPSTVIQDVQSGQFVARRVDLVFNVAKSLYTRVESASPAIVKKGLGSLDKQTEWISRPLVSKLSAVSQPVIARLDTGLASAYTQLDSRVLKPSQKLQEDLKVKVAEGVQRVPAVPDFNTFYSAAVDALHSVAESARAKAATVSFEDFATALKARLALPAQLEDALLTPAVTFYLEASSRLSGMKASAGGALAPAIEYCRAHKDLSVPQLIEGYKAQMGSLWNDRLAQPLTILFNNVRQTASEDIRRLQASAESQRALVAQQWTQLLQLSASAIDTYLPEPSAEPVTKTTETSEPLPLSVAVLASRVTRRLRTRASTLSARANSQLQTVRSLAPERVKSYLPADLIAYANNLLERVDNAYHPAQRVEQVRAACVHSVAYGQEVCKHAVTAFEARVSHLRTGLSSALTRFKAVVQTGIDQVNVDEVKNVQRDLSLLCVKTLRREESDAELRQLQTDAAALYKRMSFALKTLLSRRQQLASPAAPVETEPEAAEGN